jgi:hypothetical protein
VKKIPFHRRLPNIGQADPTEEASAGSCTKPDDKALSSSPPAPQPREVGE